MVFFLLEREQVLKDGVFALNFTKSLKKNSDFVRAYKRGRFFAGRIIVIHIFPNQLEINRIGISISKKAGNSVKRNRVKRLIRGNYRFLEDEIKKGYDIVFVFRKDNDIPSFKDLNKEMKYIMKKLDFFEKINNL